MGDYEVRITNVLGQIVVNERLQNTKEHTIDMSNIEKGLYVLVLKKGNEIIKQEKITVAR